MHKNKEKGYHGCETKDIPEENAPRNHVEIKELNQVASYKCMMLCNTQNECCTLNCNNNEKGRHTAADTNKELDYENKQPKHNNSLDENTVLEAPLQIWCRDKAESFVWDIFNRGRIVLWPMVMLSSRTLINILQISLNLATMVVCLGAAWSSQLSQAWWNWAANWFMHWKIADMINTWYHNNFDWKRRATRAKPTCSCHGGLCVLPAYLMVLSAVMQLPYALSLIDQPYQALPPSISWVEAIGGVRDLLNDARIVSQNAGSAVPMPHPAPWNSNEVHVLTEPCYAMRANNKVARAHARLMKTKQRIFHNRTRQPPDPDPDGEGKEAKSIVNQEQNPEATDGKGFTSIKEAKSIVNQEQNPEATDRKGFTSIIESS